MAKNTVPDVTNEKGEWHFVPGRGNLYTAAFFEATRNPRSLHGRRVIVSGRLYIVRGVEHTPPKIKTRHGHPGKPRPMRQCRACFRVRYEEAKRKQAATENQN